MSSYSNRHNIKPVRRGFSRAHRSLLDEVQYRVNTFASSAHGITQIAKTTAALIGIASVQQGQEALNSNTTA